MAEFQNGLRAWWALIALSIRRQARMRQMVAVALALMGLSILFAALVTATRGWKYTDQRGINRMLAVQAFHYRVAPASSIELAIAGSVGAAMDHSAFLIFSRWVVFAIFQSFLLPLWTLSFATDAIGNERESRTLIWLFTRPMPKPAVYLAKYIAALPWCLGLNLLGFAGICLAAGEPGRQALKLYWPAVFWGTFAFAALFHLIAALFRRPAIVGLIYSFFFETLVGDLPGDLKRMSLSFYIRSLMFDRVEALDLKPDQLTVYHPVSGWTAWGVLAGATIVFTLIGMIVFARSEYREDI
jgi:ABC-type transport system involved in multi-copper enzyme maturation permease subunit